MLRLSSYVKERLLNPADLEPPPPPTHNLSDPIWGPIRGLLLPEP